MRAVTLILLWVSLFSPTHVNQDKGWRRIVPLHSTRIDVERLIGPPNTTEGSTYDPRSDDPAIDRVFVEYSSGYCTEQSKGGYNVPRGTVIQLFITWDKGQDFCGLKVDEDKFEKALDPEIPGLVHYTNMEEGIAYTVENGKLKRTHYFPTKKSSHLSCPSRTVTR